MEVLGALQAGDGVAEQAELQGSVGGGGLEFDERAAAGGGVQEGGPGDAVDGGELVDRGGALVRGGEEAVGVGGREQGGKRGRGKVEAARDDDPLLEDEQAAMRLDGTRPMDGLGGAVSDRVLEQVGSGTHAWLIAMCGRPSQVHVSFASRKV